MTFDNAETVQIPGQPASMQVGVEIGAASHAGRLRPNNEDAFLVARACRTLETLQTNLPAGSIPVWAGEQSYGFVVADGMGGHAAGEVASRLALKTIIEHVLATADWIMRDPATHGAKVEERISEWISAAHAAVREHAALHPRLSGMGTTLTLAISMGPQLFLGHVGDSRAYLMRASRLQALTRDHSLVQSLAAAGVISAEEAATHRMRNVLLRSLGGGDAAADVQHLALSNGDQLLLCTDGLTEMVAEPEIARILQAATGAQEACEQLVAAALDAGGKDNVTVVLARYEWKM
jgi:protein phosphatase